MKRNRQLCGELLRAIGGTTTQPRHSRSREVSQSASQELGEFAATVETCVFNSEKITTTGASSAETFSSKHNNTHSITQIRRSHPLPTSETERTQRRRTPTSKAEGGHLDLH